MTRVDFDFDGSLELARELWGLADSLPGLERRRSGGSDAAAKDWLGAHGDTFRLRAGREPDAFSGVELRLQSAATSWAEAWARATDEQNQRDYADAVADEQASRGRTERFADFLVGDDSAQVVGPPPGTVAVPASPGFAEIG